MTPELGQLALILALLLALAQGILPLLGAWRGNRALMAVARPAAAGQAVFVALAFGILAPMYALALAGLWCARYGTFSPRVRPSKPAPPPTGVRKRSAMDQNADYG